MSVTLENNKLKISYFLYEIVHHCNLNCKSCDHCAPIAKPEFEDINVFIKDLKRMTQLFDEINTFAIMGGEPLLHPNINDFIVNSAKIFLNTYIQLWTNGILLTEMDEKFWETLSKHKIILIITKYGIELDIERIRFLCKKYNINYVFSENSNIKEKFFCKSTYKISGDVKITNTHKQCYQGLYCHQLENGKLYKCTIAPAARHFNNFFNTDMKLLPQDAINIHKVKGFFKSTKKKNIAKYFSELIPFCRYCDIENREYNLKWEISKKEISEWT